MLNNFIANIKSTNFKKVLSLIFIFALIASIALTVFLNSKQQETRSRAGGGTPPYLPPGTSISLTPTTLNANVGDTFDVNVVVSGGENNITGVDIPLRYSSDLLEVINISYADVFGNPIKQGVSTEDASIIRFAATNTSSKEIKGNITIETITFKAKASGQAYARFEDIQVVALNTDSSLQNDFPQPGEYAITLLPTSTPTPLPPTPVPTEIPVPTLAPTSTPTLSFAESCVALQKRIEAAMWSTCGEDKYDPAADVNKDKYVNGLDVPFLIGHTDGLKDRLACEKYLIDLTKLCTTWAPTIDSITYGNGLISIRGSRLYNTNISSSLDDMRVIFLENNLDRSNSYIVATPENPNYPNVTWNETLISFPPIPGPNGPMPKDGILYVTLGSRGLTKESNQVEYHFSFATPTSRPTPTPFRITGDVNDDSVVNLLDYNIWLSEFIKNVTTLQADLNKDGKVDMLDFAIIRNAFSTIIEQPIPTNTLVPTNIPTTTPVPTPMATSKRVFVTSTTYDGNLKLAGSKFGLGTATDGLDGADKICQGSADVVNLGGTWKAWLSDNTRSTAIRLNHSNIPYKLLDGTIIASNWFELTNINLPLQHSINVTELNSTKSIRVWTNTALGGISNSTPSFNTGSCNNWTSSAVNPGYGANVGLSSEVNRMWTNATFISCDGQYSLYCFEQ